MYFELKFKILMRLLRWEISGLCATRKLNVCTIRLVTKITFHKMTKFVEISTNVLNLKHNFWHVIEEKIVALGKFNCIDVAFETFLFLSVFHWFVHIS